MNPWLIAVTACLPPLLAPLWVAVRGRLADRLVAVQVATNVTILALVLCSFAFDQDSLIDLPLTLAALSLPGTLMFAFFIERWL
ncbi:MAG TPA: monovalent cation/H+ antiporter complex subunit F [Rhodopila sp.]|nr:monovalent cation/H+ antiporter complex subunit F [Rhodopila sp.]